jgi:quercetin dioxygenase-like cupin family protein
MKDPIKLSPKPEWTEKVWGRTRCVALGPNFEVHELEIKKGGYCSRHQHRKWNRFHVTSGSLRVELFEETEGGCCDAPRDDRLLSPGDQFNVAPGDWHRFVGLEDSHVLEVYWTVNIDPSDINRADQGGILN